MQNSTPFEVIAAPFSVYLAPVGESMPDISLAIPAGNWALVGTSGPLSYHDDGVKVDHVQKLQYIRTLGSTGPVKAFRVEEELKITFKVIDLTLEQYRHVLNLGAITVVAAGSGAGGYKSLPIIRGQDVTQRAMLIRGPSPYADSMNLQYEIPRCVHDGTPQVISKKGDPTALLFEFMGIEDPDFAGGRFGRIVAQNVAAS